MTSFPYFELSGTPREIGEQAGTQFGERIRQNYSFYEHFFSDLLGIKQDNLSRMQVLKAELQKLALEFGITVKEKFPDLDDEICAMAKAAGIEEWKIYCLNARTEIYRLLVKSRAAREPGECTALYFPHSMLLGQNWDWHPRLEELCVVVKITSESGRSFVMLTEPGIIGKIGLNSEGLGVCLNILFADCKITGIPIHIILRAVLECSSISEATKLIEHLPLGTTSNLLIADISGQAVDLEIKSDKITYARLDSGELIHTNHFLNEEESASATLPGSIERLNRAKELYQNYSSSGIEGMKKILSDKESSDFPICRSYSMGLDFMVGTVASVIMDLKTRQMLLVKGQPDLNSRWHTYSP